MLVWQQSRICLRGYGEPFGKFVGYQMTLAIFWKICSKELEVVRCQLLQIKNIFKRIHIPSEYVPEGTEYRYLVEQYLQNVKRTFRSFSRGLPLLTYNAATFFEIPIHNLKFRDKTT